MNWFRRRKIMRLLIELAGQRAILAEYHKCHQIWPTAAEKIAMLEEELRQLGYKGEIE